MARTPVRSPGFRSRRKPIRRARSGRPRDRSRAPEFREFSRWCPQPSTTPGGDPLTHSGRWVLAGLSVIALGILGTAVLRQRRRPEATAIPARPVARCEQCHAGIARTYAHVGMARSFRPLTEPEPDLPAAAIHHARSGRRYEVLRRGGRLVQRRYELGPSGRKSTPSKWTPLT